MLPYFQNVYANIQALRARHSDINIVLNLLNLELSKSIKKEEDKSHFQSIKFENVYFKYHNVDNYCIQNFNFEICQGDRLAIIGESGSGKTTLSNLIKGLYLPEKGRIILNGNKIINTSNISLLRKYIANVSTR